MLGSLKDLGFVAMTLWIAAVNGLRYLVFAGGASLLTASWAKHRWPQRKIVPAAASAADQRREFVCSLRTLGIFGLVGAGVLWAAQHGWTRVYFDFGERSVLWFVLSIALTIALHDAYFYWTHRLLHWRWLYRLHATHHRSTNPTPWAAYSFGVGEALIQAGFFPLAACLLPLHPLAFAIFMLFQLGENVLGHAGYEIFPRWLLRTPLGVLTNTPTHHVQHHQTFRANFGLYSNVWDRLCGTNHRGYQREFERVAGAGAPSLGPAGAAPRP
jgi:sterol desaturase/sphingolipid hydroxylase (fatty acid hydroxylase superfamily)